ncbi:MAG: hypothetical protein Ct9H300mP20_05200 [Gammaproteobacteria bacterium]|nr:MAG: hypothetical protein Ct9H300mP20_05200 [Gammaproteobacteria bacterium]
MQVYDVSEYSKITGLAYEQEVKRLQVEFLKLQNWVIDKNKRIAIVFEGRDAAGKTGIINVIKRHLMPKHINYINIGIPNQTKSKYWFDTFRKEMPKKGEITFFDRSWYSRATGEIQWGIEKETIYEFYEEGKCMGGSLLKEGIELKKIYLSITKDEQKSRFQKKRDDPLKYWKFKKHDLRWQEMGYLFLF